MFVSGSRGGAFSFTWSLTAIPAALVVVAVATVVLTAFGITAMAMALVRALSWLGPRRNPLVGDSDTIDATVLTSTAVVPQEQR